MGPILTVIIILSIESSLSNNSNNSQYLSNTNEMSTEQREVQKTENDNSSNVIS